jgi:hypothetical protein
MARDEIKYEHIVSRLNDMVERIANDCLSKPKRNGGSITGHCFGKVTVHVRGAKVGLVGFWQGQRGDAQGGNLIHLIEVANGFSNHGQAVRYAKQQYLGIQDRPFTEDEKKEWGKRQREFEKKDERRKAEAAADARKRELSAKAVWANSIPIKGTLAETYLESRGLIALRDLPTLRFHPMLDFPLNRLRNPRAFPALVCAVQQPDRRVTGVWQIFLDPKTGKKAQVVSRFRRSGSPWARGRRDRCGRGLGDDRRRVPAEQDEDPGVGAAVDVGHSRVRDP